MWHKEVIPDKTLNQKVTQQLAARGMRAPCRIAVQTIKGVVTLSGEIEFEHQRNAAIQAARRLDGVGSVIDQLRIKPKVVQRKQVYIQEVLPLPPSPPLSPGVEPGLTASPEAPKTCC